MGTDLSAVQLTVTTVKTALLLGDASVKTDDRYLNRVNESVSQRLAAVCVTQSIPAGTASSVTVKLDGVDCGGDGPSAVASPLLLCLLVAEGLALCVLEHVVGFLAPVSVCSPLRRTDRQDSVAYL